LLVTVERSSVRQDLDTDIGAVAIDVRKARRWHLVDEGRRVLSEHWDVRDLLDSHQRRRQVLSQGSRIAERAGGAYTSIMGTACSFRYWSARVRLL
jgi:hypothetical protein